MTHVKRLVREYPGIIFWTALILMILPVSLFRITDIDVWWHMQCGKSILENRAWPDFSTFYFTPVNESVPSLRHTFLGDVILYLIHLAGGDSALVFTRVIFVLLACGMLRSLAGKDISAWHLLLLIVVVVGTYQKQLVRNSVFALVLFPFIFWILDLSLTKGKEKWIWSLPPILGIWSCLHGSYLLGFGVLALALAGEGVDLIRRSGLKAAQARLLTYGSVLLASFILIALYNPKTFSYYRLNWLFQDNQPVSVVPQTGENVSPPEAVAKDVQEDRTGYPELDLSPEDLQKAYSNSPQSKASGVWDTLKFGLNNTIFNTSDQAFVSADFVSPFDRVSRLYVKVCLGAGALGLVFLVCFIRPFRLGYFLPFTAVLVAGLGYLRLCGYIPLMTAAVLFMAVGRNELVFPGWVGRVCDKLKPPFLWGGIGLAIFGLWLNLILGFPVSFGSAVHIFGIGRTPLFSKKLPDIVLSEFKENKVFTSMNIGGYLLYNWFPRKRVFVDGFFAPHDIRVLFHHNLLLIEGVNPDFLYPEYGVDLALVDTNMTDLLKTFSTSDNWYLRYMDLGMACYVYRPEFDSDIPVPTLLFNQNELDDLSAYFKRSAVNLIHSIPNMLYKKGRAKDAIAFEKNYNQMLQHTKDLVNPEFIKITRQLREHGEQIYGGTNSKAQRYEYLHNAALSDSNSKNAIRYGELVLSLRPDRLPVMMNLAVAYYKTGQWVKSCAMLDKLTRQEGDGRLFFEHNKRSISKFYWALSVSLQEDGQNLEAYRLAEKAYVSDAGLISNAKLYQRGITLVDSLNKSSKKSLALSLLYEMEREFGDSGRWLNDLAWQLFLTADQGGLKLEQAEKYSRRAVALMAEEASPMLDLAYDTLAQIQFRRGENVQGCRSMQSAFESAPENRKANYKNRMGCTP